MQTIKAAVCHKFGDPLSIEDILLRAPGSGEVEVTLEAVAICVRLEGSVRAGENAVREDTAHRSRYLYRV